MKLSYSKVIESLKNNPDELLKLKKHYKYELMDDETFLDWAFKTYDIFIDQGFIEIESKTKELTITIDGKQYIRYSLYKDNESNIELCSIGIGSGIKKHFVKENEMIEYFESIDKVNEKDFKCKNNYKVISEIFKETADDWYGTYKLDLTDKTSEYQINLRKKLSKINNFSEEKEYCEMFFSRLTSNLDYFVIRIGGNDDYSLSKEFLSQKEAESEWNRLLKLKILNKKDLENYYFSN